MRERKEVREGERVPRTEPPSTTRSNDRCFQELLLWHQRKSSMYWILHFFSRSISVGEGAVASLEAQLGLRVVHDEVQCGLVRTMVLDCLLVS